MSQCLAVVGKVVEIKDISNADRIKECVVVCGPAGKWSGVVGLDIKEEDTVTVFLQDAVLPPDDRWLFMEARGWRVRMCRFKGVPSECLIISGAPDLPVGTDLTTALNVTKYEKTVSVPSGDQKCGFPGWIPKTDEPNFQTLYRDNIYERLATEQWTATMKYDGTSCTVWNDEEGMHVCSRNWEIKEGDNLYWNAARKYKLHRLPPFVVLQFEIVGPGIQGNPLGLDEQEIRAFSLRKDKHWVQRPVTELLNICDEYAIPAAMPMECSGHLADKAFMADRLRQMADIKYPKSGKPGEGLVFRADDGSWSFKVINLKYKD